MTTKQKIQADATAYIERVIQDNRKLGMGNVSDKDRSAAIRQAEEAAERVLCPEEA